MIYAPSGATRARQPQTGAALAANRLRSKHVCGLRSKLYLIDCVAQQT